MLTVMKEILLVSTVLLAGLLPGQRGELPPRVLQSGDWRVEVRSRAISHPRMHVTTWEQQAMRFGPGDKEGKLVYCESSTGSLAVFLRDDGLCFIDPVRHAPLLSFPNGKQLAYPLRASDPRRAIHYEDLNCNGGGRVHFLGDQCVVVRHVNRLMQVASFTVNMEQQTATPLDKILEVDGAGSPQSLTAQAAMPDRLMLRLGGLLLWVNQGAHDVQFATMKDPWRRRELRAYSLEKRAFVDLASIEYQLFDRCREDVLSFIEKQSHNVIPEFEFWAVERFGTWGFRNEMDRLMALLMSCQGRFVQDPSNGKPVSSRRPLRRVYLEALLKLNE